jgi:hypothetical protein
MVTELWIGEKKYKDYELDSETQTGGGGRYVSRKNSITSVTYPSRQRKVVKN